MATTVETFANQPTTTVTAGGTTAPASGTSESWTVTSSATFPAASNTATPPTQFHVADTATGKSGEIIAVTNVSGTTWTVTRGAENSTTVAHTVGFTIVQVVSAAALGGLLQSANNLSDLAARQTALDNLAGAVTAAEVLAGNGTHVTLRALAAADLPAATTSLQGAVILDGTAADMQPTGVAAAGTSTKAAAGNHVHPYQAYQFLPESYGAKRNGKILTDAAMTNASAVLTSATAGFTAGDVGKSVVVPGAGGFLNVPLVTTIASFQSATQVTLTAAATRTVTANGALYGTDDTSAIQQAVNAAVAYAQAGGSIGEVVLSDGIYCVAGAPGGTAMNAQIQLPNIVASSNAKVNLKLTGPAPAMGPAHWLYPTPPAAGAVIASMYYNDSATPLTPNQCVIGGPVTGFGGAGGTFSNLRVTVDGLNLLIPYRPSINGLDLYGVAQADIKSFSYFCLAQPIGAAGTTWPPYIAGSGNPSPWQTFAYRTPTTGNNALNSLGKLTTYGPYHGVVFADHFEAQSVVCLYNAAAATAAGVGSAVTHHSVIQSLVSEETNIVLYNPIDGVLGSGASQAVFIASCQVENAGFIIDDPANTLYGEVRAEMLGTTGVVTNGKSGAANIRLIWDFQPLGAVASPPAVPASATAYVNQYWRDAYVIITGGTVTNIALDGVSTGLTSGTILLRSGGSITLTYTSAPAWNWWLL